MLEADPSSPEELRIRSAYAKRKSAVPEGLYSFFEEGNLFIIQRREQHLLALLRRHGFVPLDAKQLLEIGCGTGYWLREFIKWGARPENVIGIELLPDRAAEARRLCPTAVRVQCGNAAGLTLPDETFDLVFQSTVFTSILDHSMKRRVASEMLRVVKRNGLIVWYDFRVNNPWNPDVRGVRGREIHQLFPDCRVDLRRITLAPPLARLIAPRSWLACYLLEKIPFLCTHYLGVIQRGKPSRA